MTERQLLVDQIILHEGLRLKPYVDSVGKITIGVGRNLTDNGITSMEAMGLLDHDLDAAISDCATFPWFLALDVVRQRVVVDLRFNLGPIRFRGFTKTLAALESGDYVTAADQLLKSKWATQVKSRAERLARMLATGLALFVLLATPAFAQPDIVAKYRSLYPTPMTAEQKIALLRGVATEVHGGLLVKPEGSTCLGYACDILCFSSTALFDVLQAEGEAAIPQWNATSNPRGYACELVTSAPVPPPVVTPPPPTPITDDAVILAKLDALSAQLKAHDEAPSYFVKIFGNRYVQIVLAAAATYFTQHQLAK